MFLELYRVFSIIPHFFIFANMAADYNFNPAMDCCPLCGLTDFALDEIRWERSCTSCGCVGPLSWSLPVMYAQKPSTYSRNAYFSSRAVAGAILKGAGLDRHQMEVAAKLHAQCVESFYRTQHLHGRKSFIHSGFVLSKIGQHMGIDLLPFIRLPKLKKTCERLQSDWCTYINPWDE